MMKTTSFNSYSLLICFCFSFLIIYTQSLHYLNGHTLTKITGIQHTLSEQEQEEYLNKLLEIESELSQKAASLKSKANELNLNVSSYKDLPIVQTQLLTEGIKEQRNSILQIQQKAIIPFQDKQINCLNITDSEAKTITEKIAQSQKKYNTLQSKINGQQSEDCLLINELKQQMQFLQNHINHLYRQMSNICQAKQIQKFYVMNTQSQNYTYGNSDSAQSQYANKVNQYVNQGFIKMQCPKTSPYPYNFERCVACPLDTHFDLSKNMCLGCPNGYYFQSDSHKCFKSTVNNNPNIGGNYVGQIPQNDPSASTCPNQNPYYDGENCISCQIPSYFDFSVLKCKQCENGLSFLTQSQTCGYQQWNSNPDAAINACCGEMIFDPKKKTCPSNQPYFNGKQCIACVLPTYFDLDSLKCSLCPGGQGFSTKQQKCVDDKFLKPGKISNIGGNVLNYKGTPPPADQKYPSIEKCPQQYPFYNGQNCLACALPSYFNFNTNLCEVCPSQTKFILEFHECQSIKSSQSLNSNLAVINNFMGKVPSYDSNLATCPQSSPIFDGRTCVNCELPNYFDFNSHKCLNCGSSMSFNTFNRQCQIQLPSFHTKLDADNIYYNGNFNDYKSIIDKQKSSNPYIRPCPDSNPFYNAKKGSCQNCSNDYPLFDIKYNRCISCTGDSSYNHQKRVCLSNGNVSPTVERMLMNTFW